MCYSKIGQVLRIVLLDDLSLPKSKQYIQVNHSMGSFHAVQKYGKCKTHAAAASMTENGVLQ